MVADYTYENFRRVIYGDSATFVPVCAGANGVYGEGCGRFVKADKKVRMSDAGLIPGPNATCKKCGRVEMLFEGFISYEEEAKY